MSESILRSIRERQAEMEDFFHRILRSATYTQDENSILHHLSPSLESCDWARKEVAFRYRVRPWQLNPQKGCHGGILATMVDTTMGMLAMYFSQGSFVSTLNLSVNYIRPVPEGSEVITRVRSSFHDETSVLLSCEVVVAESGTVACTAVASYVILQGKPVQIPC